MTNLYLDYLKSKYLTKFTQKKFVLDWLFAAIGFYMIFPGSNEKNDWKFNKDLFKEISLIKKVGYALVFAAPVTLLNLHLKGLLHYISLKKEKRGPQRE